MSQVLDCSHDSLLRLAEVIGRGELAVVPTDTVYGIVCDPCNDQAIARLFAAKQRARTKSIQVLLDSVEAIPALKLSLPSPLDILADRFLPGSFSPICLVGEGCGLCTPRQESDCRTQAVRVPDSDVCRSLLGLTGPLAASSANRSGNPSVRTVEEAREELGDSVACYLDGGPTPGSVASTVVEADANDPEGIRILRQGVIDQAALRKVIREVAAEGGRV